MAQMLEAGIELRPGFYSPNQLEYFDCPPLAICDALAASIVSLPSYPTLTEPEIGRVCTRLAQLARS
jgi:dTDP-4-amino-4,6-dideoxygalactose transaminase